MSWLLGALGCALVVVIAGNMAGLLRSWILAGVTVAAVLGGLISIGMGIHYGNKIGKKSDK